jgi:hypothetical protein
MRVHTVLTPPGIVTVSGDVIFLNGPIQGAPDWQSYAIPMLQDAVKKPVTIASPRKDYAPGEFVYEAQVDWETHYRWLAKQNGVNLFWLAREETHDCERAYGQTSRFEVGECLEWVKDGANVAIGIEPGFSNERYIRRRYSIYPRVPIVSRLDDLVMIVASML